MLSTSEGACSKSLLLCSVSVSCFVINSKLVILQAVQSESCCSRSCVHGAIELVPDTNARWCDELSHRAQRSIMAYGQLTGSFQRGVEKILATPAATRKRCLCLYNALVHSYQLHLITCVDERQFRGLVTLKITFAILVVFVICCLASLWLCATKSSARPIGVATEILDIPWKQLPDKGLRLWRFLVKCREFTQVWMLCIRLVSESCWWYNAMHW